MESTEQGALALANVTAADLEEPPFADLHEVTERWGAKGLTEIVRQAQAVIDAAYPYLESEAMDAYEIETLSTMQLMNANHIMQCALTVIDSGAAHNERAKANEALRKVAELVDLPLTERSLLDSKRNQSRWRRGDLDSEFLKMHFVAGVTEREFSIGRLTLDGENTGDWEVTIRNTPAANKEENAIGEARADNAAPNQNQTL